jgi:hypothetical protein
MKAKIVDRLCAVLVVSLFLGIVPSEAAVRVEFPEQSPGYPFYARIEPGSPPFVIQDGTWAAIVFYRLPQCVPAGFNLLTLFDVPGAFACPLTVRGFEIWKNGGPPVDLAPIQVESRGLGAVPIWFVRWTELQTAMADGTLTVTELFAIPSLRIGSASFFQESVRPVGGAQKGSLQIVAQGLLSDGTSFQLQFASVEGQLDLTSSVKIFFR